MSPPEPARPLMSMHLGPWCESGGHGPVVAVAARPVVGAGRFSSSMNRVGIWPPPFQRSSMISAFLADLPVELTEQLVLALTPVFGT